MTYFPEFYCANMGNSVIVYFFNIFQPVEWSRCAPRNRSGSPLPFGLMFIMSDSTTAPDGAIGRLDGVTMRVSSPCPE